MIKFPFPIHVAELNDLGQEMAQALEKDLAEADWRQKRQARHTLAYVLNPANQVTTGLLEKQLAFAKRAGKAVDDKLAFMGTVVSHLANIERLYQQRLFARTIATTHLHTRSGTPANNTNTESEVIMVSRKDNKARYLVKYRDREEIYSNYHYLFSDGVMLPVDKWNNDSTASYWVKVGEVVDGGFVFANAALEQEFQQSPTVDDYFNEQRAFDSLDKLFLFFGGAYGELEWYGANFANQATLDKFTALFPEIVVYAQQFENKTAVDLIKFVNFHRKANKARERIGYIANMAYRTWLTYTFRFASWYLLFDGKLLHHTHSHGDVLALLEQARCLQAQLEQQSQRWELCRYCLLTAAIRGMGKHQELTQAGLVVNQSIFMNEKGVRYLLTGFNIEAYGEQLEFTRILKDGKLSVAENGKQVIRWADIQQGRYLRHAPNYETSSATGCLA